MRIFFIVTFSLLALAGYILTITNVCAVATSQTDIMMGLHGLISFVMFGFSTHMHLLAGHAADRL